MGQNCLSTWLKDPHDKNHGEMLQMLPHKKKKLMNFTGLKY